MSGKVEIKDIVFANERIEKALCYFNATVTATIVTAAQTGEMKQFEAQLEFARALPEVHDARWQLMKISGL